MLCEMQPASSRIWTRIAVFIFYDDNHYIVFNGISTLLGFAQSAEAVEYTDPRRVGPSPDECPAYDTKQSDGEFPVMLEHWGNAEHSFIAIAPRSTLTRNSSTW